MQERVMYEYSRVQKYYKLNCEYKKKSSYNIIMVDHQWLNVYLSLGVPLSRYM